MLLLSSVSARVTAQIVYPDSVVMIKDPKTNQVGFVIPRLVAIDYRNLVVKIVPSLEEQIDNLSAKVEKLQSIINEQNRQLQAKDEIIRSERQKVQNLEEIQKKCEKEIAAKKRWKTAALVLAGSTAITTLLLLIK